jgi:hypothetical protein
MKKPTGRSAHYVCGGCGRPFQTVLKLYSHEKTCKGRKPEPVLTNPVASRGAANEMRG